VLVGHYGPTFALKRWAPATPMWALAIGVQLVDVAWSIFVVTGIERVRIVPGITASNSLDLEYMPFTHSLVATILWSIGFAAVFWRHSRKVFFAIALAVASHWIADLLVHRPDLPILDDGYKVGLGLWDHRWLALALELGLVVTGMALYLRGTRPLDRIGRIGPYVLGVAFAGMQVFQMFGTPPGTPTGTALAAFALYVAIAVVASWLDRHRTVAADPPNHAPS
jgi:hypothetical protein